jgi:hypothetical protein
VKCKCVARYQVDGTLERQWPSPTFDRCDAEAGEDGFCAHCHPHKGGTFVWPNGEHCKDECCQTDRYFKVPLESFEDES